MSRYASFFCPCRGGGALSRSGPVPGGLSLASAPQGTVGPPIPALSPSSSPGHSLLPVLCVLAARWQGGDLQLDALVRTDAHEVLPSEVGVPAPRGLSWPTDGRVNPGGVTQGHPVGNSKLCPVVAGARGEREQKWHPAAPERGQWSIPEQASLWALTSHSEGVPRPGSLLPSPSLRLRRGWYLAARPCAQSPATGRGVSTAPVGPTRTALPVGLAVGLHAESGQAGALLHSGLGHKRGVPQASTEPVPRPCSGGPVWGAGPA